MAITVETSSEMLFKVVMLNLDDFNLDDNTPEELIREVVVKGTKSIRLSISPQIDCPEGVVSLDLLSFVEIFELFLAITGLNNMSNIGKLSFSPNKDFDWDSFDKLLEDMSKNK